MGHWVFLDDLFWGGASDSILGCRNTQRVRVVLESGTTDNDSTIPIDDWTWNIIVQFDTASVPSHRMNVPAL